MNRMLKMLMVTAALAVASATGLSAQGPMQAPPLLEANDPRAPVARGLSASIMTGDPAAAEAYVAEHSAKSYDTGEAKAQIGNVLRAIQNVSEYEVMDLRQGQEGEVIVPFGKKGAELPSFILGIDHEATAPHAITRLRFGRLMPPEGN